MSILIKDAALEAAIRAYAQKHRCSLTDAIRSVVAKAEAEDAAAVPLAQRLAPLIAEIAALPDRTADEAQS